MRKISLTILTATEARKRAEEIKPDHVIDYAEQAHGEEDLTWYLTRHLPETLATSTPLTAITIGDPDGEETLIWFS